MQHYIEDAGKLGEAVGAWRADSVIGLDTEFIRTRTFYPIPALYQVATRAATYLVDPLPIAEWGGFAELLCDASVVKVMHACSEDLEVFARHMDIQPAALFDTQVAVAFLRTDFSPSYASLVEHYHGDTLDKQATRSNWLARPLSDAQLAYARADVEHLLALHELLVARLTETGRLSWFEDENLRRTTALASNPEDYYRTLKKAWRFSPRQLARLRALCTWREYRARKRDLPRQRVIRDEDLLALASNARTERDAVFAELPEPVAGRFWRELVDVLEAAEDLPETELPAALERPLSQRETELVKRLRDVAREQANELGFAEELLSRRRDIEACLRHFVAHGELHEIFRGWRYPLVGERFEALLASGAGRS